MNKQEAIKKLELIEKERKELKELIKQEEIKEQIIPGMLYKFWDDDKNNYVLRYLKKIVNNIRMFYTDDNACSWKNAEPAWDIIWTLLDPPEWAQYAAMDENGDWCYYVQKPRLDDCVWYAKGDLEKFFFKKHPNWKDSLQKRPE